ncbi:hypothetical protein C6P46_005261 [Rhodotorula mucilaginosa]|uniref:Uncharacterized protein n=1 Tax=Rhodotorula mucilaginosa TaxID=5537 RepID=A0A9P7B580_RHOMI|nr:hypothetical protein C6P46_005261 [Rhodotorula mucilaginosa]TKA51434.1 hypothetical protein B0A53_05347 [Rhodotorula sp. CCFEE 5036]
MATEPLPQQLSAYAPSAAERDAYNYLFERADTDQLGVLTGDRAVPFFSHSALPPLILGQVWQIADPENIGFLSQDRFGVACRLIAHAQARAKTGAPSVSQDDVKKPAPQPPTFKGHALPDRLAQPLRDRSSATATAPPTSPPPPSQKQPAAAPPVVTHISPADKANYARIFTAALGGPQHAGPTSLLDGDKAREIWIKSDLPFEVLGQIWTLADTHARGQLDLTDFTIGMHLLHLVLDGKLPPTAEALPKVLDPALYKAAMATLPPAPQAPTPTQGHSAAPTLAQTATANAGSSTSGWVITPAEKQESDQWFDQLDSAHKGLLEGEQAVGFFGQSGLGVEVLAKIWDLSDLRNEGHLNKDTFAVAMHLVKRAVADPSTPLPDSLPQDLVPPSFRSSSLSSTTGPGPQKDLLDLLDDDDSTTPGGGGGFSLSPQSTGALPPLPLSPQGTGATSRTATGSTTAPPPLSPMHMRSLSPQLTGASQSSRGPRSGSTPSIGVASTMYPQLTGTSTTANAAMTPRSMTPQQTGSGGFESNFTPAATTTAAMHKSPLPQQQQQTSSSFFDDNDDADLASNARSLQSQASTLRGEADSAEQQSKATGQTRSELEKQVQAANEEISALQERVSRARATYEAEREKVEELRTRSKEQQDVLSRAKHELIRAESDLSALRMEKTEIEGELLRDKEDVRELNRKVALVEDEKRILAAEVEKLRKEARQNKGLGAIARKQLASVEGDRTKLEGEIEQLKNDAAHVDGAGTGAGVGALAGAAGIGAATSAAAAFAGGDHFSSQSGPASPTGSFHQPTDGARAAALAATAPAAHAAMVALPQTPGSGTAGTPAARTGTNPFERFMHRAPPHGPTSPTGSTTSSSTNPFAAAAVARSPLASPSAMIKQEEEEVRVPASPPAVAERGVESPAPTTAAAADGSEHQKKEDDEATSLPLAAAAAVGTGALAAISAVGAGIYEAVGGGKHDEDGEANKEQETSQDVKKEQETTPDSAGEPDPFGVPAAASASSAPEAGGFDSGFGDDFSTAPVASAIAAVEPEHEASAPTVGQLGEIEPDSGFTDAVRDLNDGAGPDAVQGTLGEVDKDAGFDEAFKEIEEHEHEHGSAPGLEQAKNTETEPISTSAEQREDDSDDDDDEEGPEEAFGASPRYAVATAADEPPTSTTASTDFGTTSVGDLNAASGTSEAPSVVAAEVAPSAEIAHRDDDDAAATSEPVKEREPTTNSSESGESFVHVPPASTVPAETPPSLAATPTPTSSHRRAAPPPPVRAAAIDNGFADASAAPAGITSSEAAPFDTPVADKAPEDDFESAFADMGISSPPAAPATAAPASSTEPGAVAPDFDSFENDFDFQPSFDTSEAAVASRNAHLASQIQSDVGGSTDFDDAAFADFDSTFAPASGAPLNSATPAASASQAADQAFDAAFDDTFDESGAPVLGKPVGLAPASTEPVTTSAPTLPRQESFAGEEEGVRTIRQMGFSREQALEALEKYDGDVNRAVNSLVG